MPVNGEEARRYYRLAMIQLTDILKSERKLEEKLSQVMTSTEEDGQADALEVSRLRRRIQDVDREISAAIELVNRYGAQLGARPTG
jgi:hypothetical protein